MLCITQLSKGILKKLKNIRQIQYELSVRPKIFQKSLVSKKKFVHHFWCDQMKRALEEDIVLSGLRVLGSSPHLDHTDGYKTPSHIDGP